jgi:hypothetical protein
MLDGHDPLLELYLEAAEDDLKARKEGPAAAKTKTDKNQL